MQYLRYKGRIYQRVATDMFGVKWFDKTDVGDLVQVLQKWGAHESPKAGRVFWHDGKQKWILIPGNPNEKELAKYLSHDDPKKFDKQQRQLRHVGYDELKDACRRCEGIDWNKVRNVFRELQYRRRND
jgi:hypothetical protein